jgi:hypothetical protein
VAEPPCSEGVQLNPLNLKILNVYSCIFCTLNPLKFYLCTH